MKIPDGRWTYRWTPQTNVALAALWNDARDRSALTEASDAIDTALAGDPTGVGESRFAAEDAAAYRGDVRVAFFGPLTVDFALSEDRREVTVFAIRRTRPGPTERRD